MERRQPAVEIVSGVSGPGIVSIISPLLVSTARCNSAKQTIEVLTGPVTFPDAWLFWTKQPKSFFSSLTWYLLVFFSSLWAVLFWNLPLWVWVVILWVNFLASNIWDLLGLKKYAASWHGAEHKVIGAYWATGQWDLETARSFSSINTKCGGGVFLGQIILLFFLSIIFLLAPYLFLALAVMVILVLWLAPIAVSLLALLTPNFLNRAFQKAFTIEEPNELQLLTAHYALMGLLYAHGKIRELPKDDRVTFRFIEE